jgi:hypothetical protein
MVSSKIFDITKDPNFVAGTEEIAPWNDPIGDRLAETITTLFCLIIVI